MFRQKSIGLTTAVLLWTTLFLLMAGLFLPNLSQVCSSGSEYRLWQAVGGQAPLNALWTMKKQRIRFKDQEYIALTNAGYLQMPQNMQLNSMPKSSGAMNSESSPSSMPLPPARLRMPCVLSSFMTITVPA